MTVEKDQIAIQSGHRRGYRCMTAVGREPPHRGSAALIKITSAMRSEAVVGTLQALRREGATGLPAMEPKPQQCRDEDRQRGW